MLRRAMVPALVVVALGLASSAPRAATDTLPASISDRDFLAMTEQMSEANGYYPSDNLTSNETTLSAVAAALARRVKPEGVYLGVGPEQNFTYIAAMRPKIAFITDIRRGNLHLQLMYKALFELSSDRADFLSRLFTKPRPAGVSSRSTAADLFDAYWDVYTSDQATFRKNLQAILDVLTKTHGFQLSQQDLTGVEYVYYAFYWHGPRIHVGSTSTSVPTTSSTNFTTLMRATDQGTGQERSFLATEENFAFLKSLQQKNLVVPIVGDFGGAKALRAVGQYLKDHGAVVTAFYVSNVEDVLRVDGKTTAFCANVASLPLDDASIFIRPNAPPQRRMLDFLAFTPGPGGGFTTTTSSTLPGTPLNSTHAFIFPPGALAPIAPELPGCAGK